MTIECNIAVVARDTLMLFVEKSKVFSIETPILFMQ